MNVRYVFRVSSIVIVMNIACHDLVFRYLLHFRRSRVVKGRPLDLSVEDRPDWLIMLATVFVETLGCHMEILNLQVLDSVSLRFVMIP